MQITEAVAKTNYLDPSGRMRPLVHLSRGEAIAAIQDLQLRMISGKTTTRNDADGLDGVTIDENRQTLSDGGGQVRLTRNQFRMMRRLWDGGGKMVTHDELRDSVWANPDHLPDGYGEVIKVMISAVRKEMRRAGMVTQIKSRWGVGYFLDGEE